MGSLLSQHLIAVLDALGTTLATGALTVAGALAELAALQNVLSGHPVLGVWEVWMGGVGLFVGLYLLGYRRVYRRHLVGVGH